LEDVISRIDAPLLNDLSITFFNQLVFHTPQLRHFINRTGTFTGRAPDRARISFDDDDVTIEPFQTLLLRVLCKPSDWQLSSLSQLYNSAISPLPMLERLEIRIYRGYWEDNMENAQWLELIHLFPSLRDLVLCEESFQLVAPALDELDGAILMDVLPVLQNIVIQPQPSKVDNEAIGKFISSRQLLGSPVTVQHRDGKDLNAY
jgi:hypothetical protein